MLGSREPGEREPQPDPSLANDEGRDPREVREQDREALAPLRPALAPECDHAEERDVRVDRDRERERPRVRGIRVAQLERDEGEERHGAGVAPEALRIRGERAGLTTGPLPHPDERVCERPPGAEGPPHVAEEEREQREPEPEDDVDPRWSEVLERLGGADEGGREHDREEHDGDRLHDDPHRPEHEPTEARPERTAGGSPLELRCLPERPQSDERDDEDDGATPVEEPRGNGKILDPPDPVAEDVREQCPAQDVTFSRASTASGSWSSRSNRPASLATNCITVGTPLRGVFSMS